MNTYNKLVRDYIPQRIADNGETPIYRSLDDYDEWVLALKTKLVEEAKEIVSADESTVLEEIADLYTALDTLVDELGFSWGDVRKVSAQKGSEVGYFDDRIFLERVEE